MAKVKFFLVLYTILIFGLGICKSSLATEVEVIAKTQLMAKSPDGIKPIGNLKVGLKGTLLKKKGAWLGVNFKGHKGWVKASAIKILDGEGDMAEEGSDGAAESDSDSGAKSSSKNGKSKGGTAFDLGGTYNSATGLGFGAGMFFPLSGSFDLGVESYLYAFNSYLPLVFSGLAGYSGHGQSVSFFLGGTFSYMLLLKGGGGGTGYGLDTRVIFNTGSMNPYLNLKIGLNGGVAMGYFAGLRFGF